MSADSLRIFVGSFPRTLDNKRRLLIPAEFRRLLQGRNVSEKVVYLVRNDRNNANYLSVFDSYLWKDVHQSMPQGLGSKCDMDDTGRIMIPQLYTDHAGLETCVKSTIFAASPNGTHLEIWNRISFDRGYAPENYNPAR